MRNILMPAVAIACCALSAARHAQAADDTLMLYTSQPNSDARTTVDAFRKAHPEIRVEWVRDGTSQLMTRLAAETSAGVVKADVLLIADSLTMQALKQRGALQPYLSPARTAYAPALYEKDGYYYGTKMITTGIAYNTGATFKPTSWNDLAQPQLKNQVTMPSPLYSGAAMIHLAALTSLPSLGWRYYEQLHANGASAQGGNGGVLTAIASGTKSYGMLVDFMAIREKNKGAPIDFVFPKEGVSVVTEPVAILKQARHVQAARAFVDFLLSHDGQALVRTQGYIPALATLPVPAGFPSRDQLKLLGFDPARALASNEADKARFGALFGVSK
ncbi:ABC transporter substrate-binding protein [Burkholderia ubonensis]|uniref:ABC transporter substrate-binding protein n=1 Tax=Burkholderia ubonensis TaxID=101571 RepID=UPI00075BFB87|nr:ABC transporter substrate-binding protein [Burkholderia ubonensis]KVL18726.1 ABC transporter substrate-binding protein [Burkholderia ubonensis]KVQ54098.1 ABC transporter substrate-binding protein [Burkholderia ubonensis]